MTRRTIVVLVTGLLVSLLLPANASVGQSAGGATPEAGSSDWRMVSAGVRHTCGLRTTGRLYCWGADQSGQLGNGGSNSDSPVPVEVAGAATDWTAVSVGGANTCAIRRPGKVYCWGENGRGQVGDGTTDSRSVPTLVVGGITNWTAVSVGGFHTCGRRGNGRLYCWGSNYGGQVGDGTTTPRRAPRLVSGGIIDWVSVSGGQSHTCAARANGRLYCWGENGFGQLGDGTSIERHIPRLVAGGVTNWRGVAAAAVHTCGRRATGQLACWGWNNKGQIGDGTVTQRLTPRQVPGSAVWTSVATSGSAVDAIGYYSGSTCARRNTGRLYCWGENDTGVVGDGTTDVDRLTPTAVAGGATDWRTVDIGANHACATTTGATATAGRAYCWGFNGTGQLGSNDAPSATIYPRPREVWFN